MMDTGSPGLAFARRGMTTQSTQMIDWPAGTRYNLPSQPRPCVRQPVALRPRVVGVVEELVEAGDPGAAGDGGHDGGRAGARRFRLDPAVEARVDERDPDKRLA